MFCPYCGKELQEGEKCDCLRANTQPVKLPDTSALVDNVVKMTKDFIMSPIVALKSHYEGDSGKEGMVFGGVFAIETLLFVFLSFVRSIKFGPALKYAFIALLLSVGAKAAFAGCLYIIQMKYNGDFKKIFGVVCYATLPQSVVIIFFGIFALIGLVKLPIVLLLVYMIFALVMGTLVTETVLANRKNIIVWVYTVFALIIMLVCYLVMKKIVLDSFYRLF